MVHALRKKSALGLLKVRATTAESAKLQPRQHVDQRRHPQLRQIPRAPPFLNSLQAASAEERLQTRAAAASATKVATPASGTASTTLPARVKSARMQRFSWQAGRASTNLSATALLLEAATLAEFVEQKTTKQQQQQLQPQLRPRPQTRQNSFLPLQSVEARSPTKAAPASATPIATPASGTASVTTPVPAPNVRTAKSSSLTAPAPTKLAATVTSSAKAVLVGSARLKAIRTPRPQQPLYQQPLHQIFLRPPYAADAPQTRAVSASATLTATRAILTM